MEKYPTKRAYATGKLYKFLKEKGIYKQFICNCDFKGNKGKDGIAKAFSWRHSKEGDYFWYNVNKEWNEQT